MHISLYFWAQKTFSLLALVNLCFSDSLSVCVCECVWVGVCVCACVPQSVCVCQCAVFSYICIWYFFWFFFFLYYFICSFVFVWLALRTRALQWRLLGSKVRWWLTESKRVFLSVWRNLQSSQTNKYQRNFPLLRTCQDKRALAFVLSLSLSLSQWRVPCACRSDPRRMFWPKCQK